MDFGLSDEQVALKHMIHDFMKKECSSEYMQKPKKTSDFRKNCGKKWLKLGCSVRQ